MSCLTIVLFRIRSEDLPRSSREDTEDSPSFVLLSVTDLKKIHGCVSVGEGLLTGKLQVVGK